MKKTKGVNDILVEGKISAPGTVALIGMIEVERFPLSSFGSEVRTGENRNEKDGKPHSPMILMSTRFFRLPSNSP
jgi:hypothetical protein